MDRLDPLHMPTAFDVETAQPAALNLIEEQYGTEGIAMLDALLCSIEEEKKAY